MKTFPKPLTPGEERTYLERCKEGDQEARNILVERNMRLVAHVAKKYQNTDYDAEDLLSVGTIGLIKAVNTFRLDKGIRLGTYAAKCVENEILMLLRASKRYSREVSLYEPIGVDKDGESVSLVDVIEMENREVLEDLILDQEVQELYQVFDACLKDQEKAVVGMRYGLFGRSPKTQREIAAKLGISRSYVSRIEKKALGKLRSELERLEQRA
ncbi:MAG TPA: RNA polymerase sporulation sigma factor SigK [Candidatus Ventrimonas merdavium]|nr:RNA polymerase sporulation sigma factor SigK [Candidatus Ventrimonas merdavium]